MSEIAVQLLQAGVYGVPTAFVFLFFRMWAGTVKGRMDANEHRIDVVRDEHNEDMKEIKEVLKSLKCVEVSNQVNELAGQVKVFIRFYQRITKKHDDDIKILFGFKDDIVKDMQKIQEKIQQEKHDSDTQSFKRKHFGVDCLLLEDNKAALDVMAESLHEKLGLRVTKSSTIPDALKKVENQYFDCAIVDYHIGDDTAKTFIDECIKRNKLTKKHNGSQAVPKILIYTGESNVSTPAGILSIEKPFKWSEMRKLMECVLEQ